MPSRTGLILSHDLCVWQNMVGNLRWNFYFITDMADSHGIKITDDLRNYYKLLEVPR